MFPDVLSKLCMREEPWASQPCVVSLVTWHVTSFFWVHVGKATGWSWNWLKVQLNLVEKFLSWPSQALAAFQAHDVHTSLMQPPALESCRAGAGEMSGNVASAATLEGTQLFPALPRSSPEFMTCSLSQCILTQLQLEIFLRFFAISLRARREPAERGLPPMPRPGAQPCSCSSPPALPPSHTSPLSSSSPQSHDSAKNLSAGVPAPWNYGDVLWDGRGLLSVTSLSLLVCPLLIGAWTWANPTNSSAFLLLLSHLISLLLLCTSQPTLSPSQNSTLKPLNLNQFSRVWKQPQHQGYFFFQKEWKAREEIYLAMGAPC